MKIPGQHDVKETHSYVMILLDLRTKTNTTPPRVWWEECGHTPNTIYTCPARNKTKPLINKLTSQQRKSMKNNTNGLLYQTIDVLFMIC